MVDYFILVENKLDLGPCSCIIHFNLADIIVKHFVIQYSCIVHFTQVEDIIEDFDLC